MTIKEKEEFINEICENFKRDVLEKVKKMPVEWTGREIREYLTFKAQENFVWSNYEDKKIKKQVKNEMITLYL